MKRKSAGGAMATLAGMILLTGCGSGAEQVLGTNSRTAVILESAGINNLDLIITEQQRPPTDPGACSNNQVNFGCTRQFDVASTTIEFTTQSIASTQPYYAYVRNDGSSRERFLFVIEMDDAEKFRFIGDVNPGETFLIARINRNSADDP
jgi:hypothetical protein